MNNKIEEKDNISLVSFLNEYEKVLTVAGAFGAIALGVPFFIPGILGSITSTILEICSLFFLSNFIYYFSISRVNKYLRYPLVFLISLAGILLYFHLVFLISPKPIDSLFNLAIFIPSILITLSLIGSIFISKLIPTPLSTVPAIFATIISSTLLFGIPLYLTVKIHENYSESLNKYADTYYPNRKEFRSMPSTISFINKIFNYNQTKGSDPSIATGTKKRELFIESYIK